MSKYLIFFIFISSAFAIQVDRNDESIYSVSSDEEHFVKIYNEGITSFQKRLEMIESATKSIKLESFIYTLDPAGKVFTELLIKKAKEGVEVQVMMDPIVSKKSVSPYHIHELAERGIEVKYYNTKPIILLGKVNYRNHRKLFVVDNERAFVGGRNIADEYFDISPDYNFTDRDLYIEGPLVAEMAKTFDMFWNDKHAKTPKRRKRPDPNSRRWYMGGGDPQAKYDRAERNWVRNVNKARKEIWAFDEDEAIVNRAFTLALSKESQDIEGYCPQLKFVTDKPGIGRKDQKKQRILKYEVFDRLKKGTNIYIENPYFIVDKETREVLDHISENEVPVKVLTNSIHSTDNIAVAAVFNSTMGKWIEKGIETFVYRADPLDTTIADEVTEGARWGIHAKTFVFDEDSFMIGSYNFDPRSNNYNMELGLFCDGSEELTGGLVSNIEDRLQHSHFIDNKETFKELRFKNVKFGKKLYYYIALIPSLLLDHLL